MQTSPDRFSPAGHGNDAPTSQPRTVFAGVLAAGLAAAVVATLTSVAGLQGTVIGAIVGSMVASFTNQLASVPLGAVERRLVRAGFSARRLRRLGLLRGILATPGAPLKLLRALPRGAVVRVLTVATMGLVIGALAISLVEVARGRPLSASSQTDARDGATTTVGELIRASEPPRSEASNPTEPPTAAQAAEVTPVITAPPSPSAPASATSDSRPAPLPLPEVDSGRTKTPLASPSAVRTEVSTVVATSRPSSTPSPIATPSATESAAPRSTPIFTASSTSAATSRRLTPTTPTLVPGITSQPTPDGTPPAG